MSFTSAMLIVAGLLVGASTIVLFSSLSLRRLRTVPGPPNLDLETMKLFPAETRAGIQLHQACFKNDPKAASEALTMWAWASGEAAMANNLDHKIEALRRPELRLAIQDLWKHLDSKKRKPWSGDLLWNAFVGTNPEFGNVILSRISV